MSDPVRTTRSTYDRVAGAFLENTRDRSWGARHLDAFARRVDRGATVLDLGSGPGCDAAELAGRGLRVVACDLSMGMLRAGRDVFQGPRVQGDLRALPFASGRADGVWANACLLHLAPEDLRRALCEMALVCRPGAPVHLSVKRGAGAGWENGRYGEPRWFQYWCGSDLDAELTGAGWSILESHEESSRRDDWLVRLVASPAPPG